MTTHRSFRPALPAAFAAILFLLVLGAKWAIVDRYGSAMPDWDQWDAEGLELLIPWFARDNFLSHLFHPHNEHRVILTKLQTLALTLLNGQWDSRLLCVVNAVLHSAVAAAFWWVGRRWVAARWQPALFLLTAALFGLPFAWQNILGGFHSQQYWLVALSFVTIAALPDARPWSGGWWVAVGIAALALLTMGSGLLAAAVAFAVVGFRILRGETAARAAWPTLAAAGLITAIGLITRVEVDFHANLKATGVRDFVLSTLRSMEWPLRDQDWAGPILWLPWLLGLGRLLARRPEPGRAPPDPRAGETIAALGGWVMLQMLATAYARGVGADYPASRYMDTLAVGAFANGAALAWLASEPQLRRGWRLTLGLVAAAWLALLGTGLTKLTVQAFEHDLPGARSYYGKAESYMRGYLATNDPAQLAFPDIPYPSAETLIERLANPPLRAAMPAVLRAPLPLAPAAETSGEGNVFRENLARSLVHREPPTAGLDPRTPPLDYVRTWGSFGTAGAAATGEWRSGPLIAPLRAWLRFETAGHLGEPGVRLELQDARTGRPLAEVRPSRTPGNAWRAAYVRAPRDPFVVVARDTDATRWLAFGPPVEVGHLSYRAWRASKHGLLILWLATGAAVLLTAYGRWQRTRERDAQPVAETAASRV